MKKEFVCLVVVFLILASFVTAHGEEEFHDAEEIIQKEILCDDLSEEDLEILGDYYMEQIHPGEAHIKMDKMMGGEGSESLRQMHINMGIRFYCNNNVGTGMMGMMYGQQTEDSYGYGFLGAFQWVFLILVLGGIIFVLVYLIKNKNSNKQRKKKK